MPDHRCCSSGLCLHDLAFSKDDDSNDFEFVEVDPSGRYGRYKEVLGKGAFKTVYKAFDQVDGIEVAWNQVQVQDVLQTPEDLDRLYSEVHLLKTLKHKNIIKFYHSWVDTKPKNVNFITEIFTSGTLRQYRKRHKHVDIKAVKNWSRQILRGLLYLHSHDPPIIHRDLKCDNILVNGNQGEVKIGDLGLATILRRAHAAHSVIGTPEFMAPELYEEEYTELVDIYSFGMCLLEMVTSDYPYSECTNAAQIYKKVTSGKKPDALNKVKDPELYQFIEKCLATASKRLPARELLMDPFLQCEGNREAVETLSPASRIVRKTNDMDDLGVYMEEPHGKSATVQISYKLKETLPSFPDDRSDGDLKSSLSSDHLSDINLCKPMPSSHSREERARSVDFRVKGKRREDDTVFLRLRIADPEGQVRNIHFPFDVEGDTAMCVASEMVAELDLTDQDVTKIAEMIDAAILALVPEWTPGVAIDETCCDGEAFADHISNNLVEDGYSRMPSVFDPLSTMSSESSLEDKSLSPSRVVTSDALSPPRIDGTMHGRFEEVTYHCHRPDFSAGVAEEQCTVSSDSSDILKGEDWGPPEGSSSPASQISNASLSYVSLPKSESANPQFESLDSKEVAAAFNELVESKRKAGLASYTHKTWEGIVQVKPRMDYYAGSVEIPLLQKSQQEDSEVCRPDIGGQNLQQFMSAPPSLDVLPDCDDDYDDESAAQELRQLALRHEEELRELQRKHEEALSHLRNRWRQKRSSKLISTSYSRHRCDIPILSHEIKNGMQAKESLVNDCLNLRDHEAPCRVSRNLSDVGSASTSQADRCSNQELKVALAHVNCEAGHDVGSFDDSVASFDDLSSFGQATPRSTLKVAGWHVSTCARDTAVNASLTESLHSPATREGRDCKSSTLKGQNLMELEGEMLCISLKAKTVEQIV